MANQPTKYRKFIVGAASAALVASAVAPVASAKDFTDTKGNTHEKAIDALSDAGIISGYQDGSFKPNQTLTRSDVVKLMGKWLVSVGYEVPTDYKTNPRFTDLTSATNDELLKYAAVVKDNGVFNGSNGRLLAGDNITRENMAVVLVRAFDTVKDINLVEYVDGQDFKQEVADRNSAKSEARPAIDVLDFFDITTVAQFNPKGTTTRGHFATFLYNFLNADLSKVTGVVAGVESITAVNNTTVEVKFVEKVEDLAALNFKIDGLEITNKVLKQTDAKTVVLTTAVQEGGKTYTVTANDNKIGTFSGVSAVVPTGINVTTKSLQGVLGKDVTVTAAVTVPEGQSKAGVPVTFNVVNSSSNNEKLEAVAYTDDKGVASYTYTRYYASQDNVTAYATHRSSVHSSGKVYWATAAQLTIKDVTEKTTLANGDKKVYEIISANNKGGVVFVAFKENLDVTPDKIEDGVHVDGNRVYALNADGKVSGLALAESHPYKTSYGSERVIAVPVDNNGKANLVLSGKDASVTPIVYEGEFVGGVNDNKALPTNYKAPYSPLVIQATASTVKFEKVVNYGLTLEAQGVAGSALRTTDGLGGRDYVITYTKEDGKPVAANTPVYVAIPTAGLTGANFVMYNANEDVVPEQTALSTAAYKIYQFNTNKDGKVTFHVTSNKAESYVQPIAFLNDNNPASTTFFDTKDTQVTQDVTYFVNEVTYAADLDLLNTSNRGQTSFAAGHEGARFSYQLVDQNGKTRAANASTDVTFRVTTGENAVTVVGRGTVHAHQTQTFTATLHKGQDNVYLDVTAFGPTSVSVYATSSQSGLTFQPTETKTATFAATSNAVVNGTVTNLNKSTHVVTINNVPYNLVGATYLNQGTAVPTLSAFYDHLAIGKTVSVTKDADGNLVFNLTGTGTAASVDAVNNAATAGQVLTALKSYYPGFSALSFAAQQKIAKEIYDLDEVFNADSLTDAYDTALENAVASLIDDAAGLTTPTYAQFVSAVKDIPGASASVTALEAITDKDVQNEILEGIAGLATPTTATAFNTAVTNLINAAKAAVNDDAIEAALEDVNDALVGLNANPATHTYAQVIKALEDGKTLLGLDLAAFNKLTETKQKAVLDLLSSTGYASPAVLQEDLDKKVKSVADVTAPKVESATFNVESGDLTLTFSENVALDADVTAVSIAFKNGVATGTVSAVDPFAEATGNKVVISLDPEALAAFKVGSVITSVTTTGGKVVDLAATPNPATLTGLNIEVKAAPVTP